ncbi:MAG TPA: hypothetical protein PKM22_14945, partial [Candidatus Hydrogenedentes bacterium]|nr:hypothetical protein [Candidatus Hydrogenedentota bacterium]
MFPGLCGGTMPVHATALAVGAGEAHILECPRGWPAGDGTAVFFTRTSDRIRRYHNSGRQPMNSMNLNPVVRLGMVLGALLCLLPVAGSA